MQAGLWMARALRGSGCGTRLKKVISPEMKGDSEK